MINIAFYCTKDHPKYKDTLDLVDYLGADLLDSIDDYNNLTKYDCVLAWYAHFVVASPSLLSSHDLSVPSSRGLTAGSRNNNLNNCLDPAVKPRDDEENKPRDDEENKPRDDEENKLRDARDSKLLDNDSGNITYFLSILDKNNNFQKYLYIDYINNIIAGKSVFKLGYKDTLPKAMGLGKLKDNKINILDGTAGFTIDSFTVLKLNSNISITLVEQSKVMYCLIKDAIERLKFSSNHEHKDWANRLSIVNSNFVDYLQTLSETDFNFDVIYLDPMFNKYEQNNSKSTVKSKPKKNMQLLQDICFNPISIEELLNTALDYLKKIKESNNKIVTRLVLKRSKAQSKLLEKHINYFVESKQIRYDVYL